MPPQRTIPPAKAIKTERTHEENQERAYIAASRRSDRSLEARVESARRASEIHKRRTGRSLRVTEQDVVNEEMYEEEDDDLPLQYRRLTAHLQTGSTDFNRRLAAYLTNHVAMRSALDQAITNSYAQQYPNAPQFAHNQQSMFPSPLMTQNLQQQPQMTQSPVTQSPKTTLNSPASYRAAPYPAPGTAGYRPNHHSRSMSTSVTHDVPGFMQNFPTPHSSTDADNTARRMSTPASTTHSPYLQRSTSHQSASATNSPNLQRKSPPTSSSSMQPPPKSSQPAPPQPDLGPLTMQLPMESQMFLNPVLDSNDPMSSKMMAGSEFLPGSYFNSFMNPVNGQGLNNSFFNFNTDLNPKFEQTAKAHPSYDGMNATLAPSALNLGTDYSATDANFGGSTGHPSSAQGQDHGLWYSDTNAADHKGVHYTSLSQGGGSGNGSGNVTPGENAAWDAFINSEQWAESGS